MNARVRSLKGAMVLGVMVVAGASVAPAGASTAAPSASAVRVVASATVRGLLPWPVLREGHNGNMTPVIIQSLQYLLNAHGARLETDGQFGLRTEAAVLMFQRSVGIEPTGVVYAGTWLRLITTVRAGSQGPAVRALQTMLNYQHGRLFAFQLPSPLAVDGMFGPKTAAAVWAFQRAVTQQVGGSSVDGTVGPRTWQALETFID